jgi:hypothetical protein
LSLQLLFAWSYQISFLWCLLRINRLSRAPAEQHHIPGCLNGCTGSVF